MRRCGNSVGRFGSAIRADSIQAGSIWVNCHSILDPALPFGGFKQSGLGREMGHEAIEHYTEVKSVLMNV